MKEFINFSVYPCDTDRFGGDFDQVKVFLEEHGVDGLELLVGTEEIIPIPKNIVGGVHLPSSMGWYRTWRDDMELHSDIEDDIMACFYYGGKCREDILNVFRETIKNAVAVEPAYAVFHVTYVEPHHVYTGKGELSDHDVLDTTAEFLNEAFSIFPDNEPPVRIFFENLWWSGLTYLNADSISYFMDKLKFSNWAFLLDTGHLMSAIGSCDVEDDAIDKVIDVVNNLPDDVVERIEGVHFHCSLSGSYHQKIIDKGLPEGFRDLTFSEQYSGVMQHISKIDQHMPFKSPECSRIVDAIKPEFLTHEFVTGSLEEFSEKIRNQQDALHGKTYNA